MQEFILTSQADLESIIERVLAKILKENIQLFRENPTEDILSVEGAADFLNLSKSTIYHLTSNDKVPHYKQSKKLYFKRSELIEWLENSRSINVNRT